MTNRNIPDLHPEDLEHARSYVEDYLDATYAPDRTLAVARVLHALLPTPPRPTLADMTNEDRDECEWMQCDVGGEDTRAVIFNPYWEDGSTRIMWPDGVFTYPDWERVTPRPDLPRFVWPGDTPAPALPEGWRLADHETYGRVIVTSTAPDADGDVCFVAPVPGIIGNDWHLCDPDALTYLDTDNQAQEKE